METTTSPRLSSSYRNSGGNETEQFFTDVEQGGHKPLQPLRDQDISRDADHRRILEAMRPHYGNFDEHMETSIPDYRNLSLDKAHSLLQQPGGRLLDIAGGTGAWAKALTMLSNGAWRTDVLDPNKTLVDRFNQTPVPGASIIPEAFGEGFEGAPRHQPRDPYDIVHESMGLQFIGSDRPRQVSEAKRFLRPGGLFITDQKFHRPDWDQNEHDKDTWKQNYYSPADLARKNQEVGFQGDGSGVMVANLWPQDKYHQLLQSQFAHVAPYWQSGNFGGYAASDDPAQVEQFMNGLKRKQQMKTSSKGSWFAPSYMIPDDVKAQLHQYARHLPWPDGSTLNEPSKYHITGMYSPEGFENPEHHDWINSQSNVSFPVQTHSLESFAGSPSKKGYPVVLRVAGPELERHGENLMNEAEQRGLPVSRFEGGYKPHITLGYSPEPIQADPPRLSFEAGPLAELHTYYDSLKRQSNILDPIHRTLPPVLWDDPGDVEPRLKPQHRDWIMKTAFRIFNEGGYEGIEKYLTFIVTGSITTYQYSDSSDVDTSLFVDFEQFPEWSRAEMIGLLVEKLDGVKVPGTPYDLQLFVQASSIQPEDVFKPGLRAGYNLNDETWLSPPDRSRVHDIEREMHDTYTYALESADKLDRLLTYEPQKAVLYWNQLHRRRSKDQQRGKGDFSPSNIAYKFIVNRGLTKRLEEITGKRIVL